VCNTSLVEYGLCDLRVRVEVGGYTVPFAYHASPHLFFFVLYSVLSLCLLYPCIIRYGDVEPDRRGSWR